jgi:hypothetical protein
MKLQMLYMWRALATRAQVHIKKTMHGWNQHDKVLGDNENESTLKEIPHTWSDHDGGNIVRHGFNNNINGGWSRVSHNIQVKIPKFNFNGEIEMHEWISKLGRSFQHTKGPHEKTKVCMALRHMEGVQFMPREKYGIYWVKGKLHKE